MLGIELCEEGPFVEEVRRTWVTFRDHPVHIGDEGLSDTSLIWIRCIDYFRVGQLGYAIPNPDYWGMLCPIWSDAYVC